MRRYLVVATLMLLLSTFLLECAHTVYIPEPPPPVKHEMRPPKPGPGAVWVSGHWKWDGNSYAWISGHWERHPKGHWVPGHYAKRRHGWIWVPGHWRR